VVNFSLGRIVAMAYRQIIRVALLVAIAHFVLTSLVGYYAAYRVGGSFGENVAGLLIDAYESRNTLSEPAIEERYREVKARADATAERWQPVFVALSLPIKFVVEPVFEPISRGWFDRALSGDLSRQGLRLRMHTRIVLENLLNSAFLGLLIYIALCIRKQVHAP
jgi:hypothetical protein